MSFFKTYIYFEMIICFKKLGTSLFSLKRNHQNLNSENMNLP